MNELISLQFEGGEESTENNVTPTRDMNTQFWESSKSMANPSKVVKAFDQNFDVSVIIKLLMLNVSVQVLVVLQAFLTVVGNCTMWAAAYRIWKLAQEKVTVD